MVTLPGLVPLAVTAVLAGAVALPSAASATTAAPGVTFTKLTLIHGWGPSPFGTATPAIADISGIVYFKGAISSSENNMNDVPFVLPKGFRPGKTVTIPVDMCDDISGELLIAPNGVTQVISEGASSTATCFTSLDGASFAPSAVSFTQLKLQNGWKEFSSLFRTAAVRLAGGFVQFTGAIKPTGKSLVPFTLPAKFRPSTIVHILIHLCTGEVGELDITPKGQVKVQTDPGESFAIKCGATLDGASFAQSPKSFTPLTLINGWKNATGSAKASARVISGIVHLRGAIKTSGTSSEPFVLPTGFRPLSDVFVPVDLCNGEKGRLHIAPSGQVGVEGLVSFATAQCLTSLDGVSFAR